MYIVLMKKHYITTKKIVVTAIIIPVLGLVGLTAYNYGRQSVPVPINAGSPDQYELWNLTNQDRAKAGLAPLKLNAQLEASATAKCVDMVVHDYYAHTSPQGLHSHDLIQSYTGGNYATDENLAEGYSNSQATEDAWLASPAHKAGILNPNYTDVGFGVCTNKHAQYLVVAHFIGS